MAPKRLKWKCVIIFYLVLLNVFSKSLPVYDTKLSAEITTDTNLKKLEIPLTPEDFTTMYSDPKLIENKAETSDEVSENLTLNNMLRNVRPGQEVKRYAIELTNEGDYFRGHAIIDVSLESASRENPIKFHVGSLRIQSVRASLTSESNANNVDFRVNGRVLDISPRLNALFYVLVIEYTGQYTKGGLGFHKGTFDADSSYLAMNLHPTYARHVFPCMDEPTEPSTIRFTYNDLEFGTVLTNSQLEEGTTNQFRALVGPPHGWGMIAHNFINTNIPTTNVLLYVRPGITNQDATASVAINSFFNNLQEWTDRDYFNIHPDQDGRMNIIALPDISTDWHSLSTVGIWEPNILMEINHSVKQRKTAFFEIAQAMAKQWFGFVIYPENWRDEWVVSGLASYAAYEMMKLFQSSSTVEDVTLLDVNTLFVTDVIQESLLRDAYVGSHPLEPDSALFNENDIRDHVNGLIKLKAPAILRMMRIILGDPDQDFIHYAAKWLLNRRTLDTVNFYHLVDGINSDWLATGSDSIGNVHDYLNQWKNIAGYPVLRASWTQGGVLITQEHFSFGQQSLHNFPIPVTFTTSIVPNFSSYQPAMVIDTSWTIPVALAPEDWILLNIQGQGYYRVTYDNNLWENIIEALSDPETRDVIHPLNRATLVDDSLNLARAGRLAYDIAFRVVLAMEHETEYAVWKAFVRNMEFLRKRLIPFVEENELDPDIYVRMVRRTIIAVEDELGFQPEPNLIEPAMHTLTRGLVMEHACKANYDPCIAAAVDWFYDSNNAGVVNPNIPHELRPTVYCTMVRVGDEDVIEALNERLIIEPTLYERVVILESFACSQDGDFIMTILEATIAEDSPYTVEERTKIFAAVVESGHDNANRALEFISSDTPRIINMYGGLEKFEELIFVLTDNMANDMLATNFQIWVNTQDNHLGDSGAVTRRALLRVIQDSNWQTAHIEGVYEWIDKNDASTMVLSFVAICISIMVALLNH